MTINKPSPFDVPAQSLGWDNPEWDAAQVRILYVRLSPWRDVQRSSPHLFLYSLMRKTLESSAFGDFAFFPSYQERNLLDVEKTSWLRGIASHKRACEFDAILFSVAYALELVNLPLLLLKSGIPLRASQRDERWPLVLVGGSNSLANQGLIFMDGDSFADGLYFGEAEAVPGGAELFTILATMRGQEKRTVLARIEETIPAFWAYGHRLRPDRDQSDLTFRVVQPARSLVQEEPFLPEAYPILNSPEASTGRLQISWGCPSFCTFCFEGWERKPYREVPQERILEMAKQRIRNTGASTLELYSFNFNAHSDILSLLLELNKIFDRVNMMSQRADILAGTPGMLECELAAEKRSFTIGVEGISEGMRALYAKGLTSKILWKVVERLCRAKVREIKFFYIISGFETESDVQEFTQFCRSLKDLAEQQRPSPRLLFSAGFLVRMPFTPMRYAPIEFDQKKLEGISNQIKRAVEASGFEYRLAMEWDEYVADQLLVLGDYRLADALEMAASRGILYDNGIRGNLTDMLRYSLNNDSEPNSSFTAEKYVDYSFPLTFVQPAIPVSFLYKAYKEGMERREAASCFGSTGTDGRCMACGACKDNAERSFLTGHKIGGDPAQTKTKQLAELIRAKRRIRPRYIKVHLGPMYGGAYPEYLGAILLKKVLTKHADLTGRLFRITEALWTSAAWKDRIGWGFTGETLLALYGINNLEQVDDVPILDAAAYDQIIKALSDAGATAFFSDPERIYPQEVEITFPTMDQNQALSLCRKWLAALKVAYTERKGSIASHRIFEIAPKDKKKRILSEVQVWYQQDLQNAMFSITGGPKLDISYLIPTESDRFSTSVRITRLGEQ